MKFTGETAENLSYKPNKFNNSFYQICNFKNPFTNLYPTRKVIFNENFEIIKIFEKEYNFNTLNKFMETNGETNKFTMHPTNDISCVDLPNVGDFMIISSDLINSTPNTKYQDKCGLDSFNEIAYGGMLNTYTMASPGASISKQTRKVGGADKSFYNGAPTNENLTQINNNQWRS